MGTSVPVRRSGPTFRPQSRPRTLNGGQALFETSLSLLLGGELVRGSRSSQGPPAPIRNAPNRARRRLFSLESPKLIFLLLFLHPRLHSLFGDIYVNKMRFESTLMAPKSLWSPRHRQLLASACSPQLSACPFSESAFLRGFPDRRSRLFHTGAACRFSLHCFVIRGSLCKALHKGMPCARSEMGEWVP